MKFSLLPLIFNNEKDTYSFKWLTPKAIIHVFILGGSLIGPYMFQFFLISAYGMSLSTFVGKKL